MRLLRTLGWAVAGAVPGVMMGAIVAVVESQRENLLLGIVGALLAILGAVIGAFAGWQQERRARWRVAAGAIGGVLAGAAFILLNDRFGLFRPAFGFLALLVAAVAGTALGHRSAPSTTSEGVGGDG
jgi:drug/metabolite transporter (DMT)-like permease